MDKLWKRIFKKNPANIFQCCSAKRENREFQLTFFIVMRVHMGSEPARPIRKPSFSILQVPFDTSLKTLTKKTNNVPGELLPADLAAVHL